MTEQSSEAKMRPVSYLLSRILRDPAYETPMGEPLVKFHDVREALRSERAVAVVMTAQREHVVMTWCCFGCCAKFDSQREADEHPVRMGLAALAGGCD